MERLALRAVAPRRAARRLGPPGACSDSGRPLCAGGVVAARPLPPSNGHAIAVSGCAAARQDIGLEESAGAVDRGVRTLDQQPQAPPQCPWGLDVADGALSHFVTIAIHSATSWTLRWRRGISTRFYALRHVDSSLTTLHVGQDAQRTLSGGGAGSLRTNRTDKESKLPAPCPHSTGLLWLLYF